MASDEKTDDRAVAATLAGECVTLAFTHDACVVTPTAQGVRLARALRNEDAADVDRVADNDYLDGMLCDFVEYDRITLDWSICDGEDAIRRCGRCYVVGNRLDAVKRLAKGETLTWPRVDEDRGDFVSFRVRGDSLVLVPNLDGKAEAQRLIDETDYASTNRALAEMIEDVRCNSDWEDVPPEAVGALTEAPILSPEAPILSRDMRLDDHGKWTLCDVDVDGVDWAASKRRPVVYAHTNYAVEDPIAELAAGRSVTFQGGEVSQKTEKS